MSTWMSTQYKISRQSFEIVPRVYLILAIIVVAFSIHRAIVSYLDYRVR